MFNGCFKCFQMVDDGNTNHCQDGALVPSLDDEGEGNLMKILCWNCLLPLFAVLIAAAPPANAQSKMFKCMIDGRTVYQQTACPVTQQANAAKPAADAASAPASSASRPTARAPAASVISGSPMQAGPTGVRAKALGR